MDKKESVEDYLESILRLSEQHEYVRSIDVVNDLKYSKPSISIAMRKLSDDNLVEIDTNGHIFLTKEGEKIAKNTYNRHKILTKYFINIGVDEQTAAKDACRVEHDLSEKTFKAIEKLVKK